jgi:hypothetical protein
MWISQFFLQSRTLRVLRKQLRAELETVININC